MTPGQWYQAPDCLPVLVMWIETRHGYSAMVGLRLHRDGSTQKQTYPYRSASRMLLVGRPDGAEVAERRAREEFGAGRG